MHVPEELQVEVFRAGDYGPKGQFAETDLQRMAADYDPAIHEAPVTFDHEQKGPAHGWVKSLRCAGQSLIATIAKASDQLATALRDQQYKKRSIELYPHFSRTGGPYVKAVSFLGAAAPEVKGMADPVFREDDARVQRFVSEPEAPGFGEQARAKLMQAGRWRPEWDRNRLTDVFDALPGEALCEALLSILADAPQPVPFGQLDNEPAGTTCAFAEELAGGVTPARRDHHRQAATLMKADPSLEYRDALLRAAQS